MSWETTRREMMKGMALGGGASLLVPFVNRLAAQAAGDSKRVRQQRVIFVIQSNGMSPKHITPSTLELKRNNNDPVGGSAFTDVKLADHELPDPIAALSPFKNRMALIHNLSGRIAVSDHSANLGALGCYPGKEPHAETIDYALGQALPNTFPHVAIGYHQGEAMTYAYCASGPGKRVPIISRPDLAYKSLFGSAADGADREAFDQKTNLLDFMATDVRRARGELVGDERQKFDRYLEAFESLHRRQQELLAKAAQIKKHAPKLDANLSTSSVNLEAQFEIAAAAIVAGLTNVVTIASGAGGQQFGTYPELGIPGLHHIGHGGSYGEKSSEQCFVELRKFHVKLIAGLLTKLAAAKEGDGSILDNTLVVYLSDSGESHHPQLREWPVVLVGNLAGQLATNGRFLRFPAYGERGHRTMANLYLTLLHAVGKPRDKFGLPDLGLKHLDQTGPLAELLA